MDTDEREVSVLSLLFFSLQSACPFCEFVTVTAAGYCHAWRLLAANVAAGTGLSAVTYLFN